MACTHDEHDEKEKILKLAGLSKSTKREEGEKKFVAVGNKACGKTSFIECFILTDNLHPEIHTLDPMRKVIVRNNQLLNLVFRELPSSDSEFDVDVRARAYPGSAVVFLCFAIDDRHSFGDIFKWHAEAKKYVPDAKFFVIGCKMDTRVDDGSVSREEGLNMSGCIRATKYYECSAMSGLRVALNIKDFVNILSTLPLKFK
ncbi:uncharacterized protein TNCT_558951 [Trichonephila clavata]|uniref:Uncharacterized protein n=1 Tax=Trichonephila clavata TaxID=2740835 RepID=A0A8X6HYI6_TRICU|nr:uncharacterized protein TNCT_558951 [Trichonephila clavata]